ncbi:M99 family carboxypeptidase catalytic domain-containing protein [Haladaptatus cibarius]|uniref:M99 family carboxypeptidase catalytic domain-containing protein n=1 Tax=Haladaptatus cibarius TaxID=453847 RepID=UPI000678C2CB|nr:succinylglutamate desuccinylase/aspartoacylase family protein [Haladaptatus cibarius]
MLSATPLASAQRSDYTIRTGTSEETTVYVREADADGPTVMVVGGMHGDEANGYTAAQKIADWRIDAGKLVVLPEANVKAIRNDSRVYNGGIDLNRQFPAGSEPTTALAREIWDVVVSENIDFLFDLHSSYGIYSSDDGGVGQGIFSTRAASATGHRKELVSYLNKNYIADSTYDYSGYSSSDGSSPMLKHKVGADLDTGAIIFETTRKNGRPLSQQVRETTAAVQGFLQRFGLITETVSYSQDVIATNTAEDTNTKQSGLRFDISNTFGQDARITDLEIDPHNSAIDQLRDHSYSEGQWISELFIDADVQNGVTDINYGVSLPCSIDLGSDGHSDSADKEAVLSADSLATVSLYQFKSNGSPVDMAGEPVTFTVHYELADGTPGFDSFTVGGDALVYEDDVQGINAPVDSNGKQSGLKFSVTNDAGSNMTIHDVAITPENSAIDQLRDHSYSEGQWISELFIDADVQNGVTDINNGVSLPCSIDLDWDGHSTDASNDAILSPGSSGTVSLYQFKSNGSPVDMVGENVEITIDYTLGDGSSGSRTFMLLV